MRFGKTKSEKVPYLGALELAVLKQLWDISTDMDARSMHDRLAERSISLSTVQATLERLSRKGIVNREKLSRAYFYRAAVTREELIAQLFGDVTRRLAEGKLEPAISGFIDLVGETDPRLLEQLEADARRRRKGR
jgi:predicted transcriptional regulator